MINPQVICIFYHAPAFQNGLKKHPLLIEIIFTSEENPMVEFFQYYMVDMKTSPDTR